jgi:hypothetical protein
MGREDDDLVVEATPDEFLIEDVGVSSKQRSYGMPLFGCVCAVSAVKSAF